MRSGTVNSARSDAVNRSERFRARMNATVKNTVGATISDSLRRLQDLRGGKDLATYFDGRENRQVAVTTISRWISTPRRFPAIFVPVLAELDPQFRAEFTQAMFASSLVPAQVMDKLPAEARQAFRRVIEATVRESLGVGDE